MYILSFNVNNTHLFMSISEGETNYRQSETFNYEKEKKGEAASRGEVDMLLK